MMHGQRNVKSVVFSFVLDSVLMTAGGIPDLFYEI